MANATACQRRNSKTKKEKFAYLSEIMTTLILFHRSHYRDFKAYYTGYVQERLRRPQQRHSAEANRLAEHLSRG